MLRVLLEQHGGSIRDAFTSPSKHSFSHIPFQSVGDQSLLCQSPKVIITLVITIVIVIAICSTNRDKVGIAVNLHESPRQADDPVGSLSRNQGTIIWSTKLAIPSVEESFQLLRFTVRSARPWLIYLTRYHPNLRRHPDLDPLFRCHHRRPPRTPHPTAAENLQSL